MSVAVPAFLIGALVSLGTSWLLVSRLERIGEHLGLSEALLGLVAALAADAPEITAAVSATAGHQQRIGTGVVIGSNVFNLAALLGLGAVVAGRIGLHRKVVLLAGVVAMWVAVISLAVISGTLPVAAGFALVVGGLAVYAAVLGASSKTLGRLPLPEGLTAWLRSAVAEEGHEMGLAIRPARARRGDAVVAAAALLVVVAASAAMERAAAQLGGRFAVPEIVIGGLVLAAVTSLPNAVAAVYLAARGRGAATLSTALNSNALNVAIGLLLPAAVIGLGDPTAQTILIGAWYAGLTAMVLVLAYRQHGITRVTGALIIAAYVVFAGSLLGSAYAAWMRPWMAAAAGLAAAAAFCARLAPARRGPSPVHQPLLLPGWRVGQVWATALVLTVLVAATDAALGHRVVLIGMLIIGPCGVLITGRWIPTGLTGLWAVGLAVVLGVPDGIWGTSTHLAFLAAVAVVAVVATTAAGVIQGRAALRTR
jgi:cation:H+ antiporter